VPARCSWRAEDRRRRRFRTRTALESRSATATSMPCTRAASRAHSVPRTRVRRPVRDVPLSGGERALARTYLAIQTEQALPTALRHAGTPRAADRWRPAPHTPARDQKTGQSYARPPARDWRRSVSNQSEEASPRMRRLARLALCRTSYPTLSLRRERPYRESHRAHPARRRRDVLRHRVV
jgi:hypothetical protein